MSCLHPPGELVVKLPTDFSFQNILKDYGLQIYKTTSKCRGVVKIINIKHVLNKLPREGSEIDVANLQSLFKQMGFIVDVYQVQEEEKNKKNILKCVKDFVTDDRLKSADIAMLFIMSYGDHLKNKDVFYTSDGKSIEYDCIKHYFTNKECPNMQYKPKLIFFQTSLGGMTDTETKVRNPGLQFDECSSSEVMLPSITDLLVARITTPENVAFCWPESGSFFIYRLCEEFMNNAYRYDVATMLDHIYWQTSKDELVINGNRYLQTGDYNKTAFKLCFLNPGVKQNDTYEKPNITDKIIDRKVVPKTSTSKIHQTKSKKFQTMKEIRKPKQKQKVRCFIIPRGMSVVCSTCHKPRWDRTICIQKK